MADEPVQLAKPHLKDFETMKDYKRAYKYWRYNTDPAFRAKDIQQAAARSKARIRAKYPEELRPFIRRGRPSLNMPRFGVPSWHVEAELNNRAIAEAEELMRAAELMMTEAIARKERIEKSKK